MPSLEQLDSKSILTPSLEQLDLKLSLLEETLQDISGTSTQVASNSHICQALLKQEIRRLDDKINLLLQNEAGTSIAESVHNDIKINDRFAKLDLRLARLEATRMYLNQVPNERDAMDKTENDLDEHAMLVELNPHEDAWGLVAVPTVKSGASDLQALEGRVAQSEKRLEDREQELDKNLQPASDSSIMGEGTRDQVMLPPEALSDVEENNEQHVSHEALNDLHAKSLRKLAQQDCTYTLRPSLWDWVLLLDARKMGRAATVYGIILILMNCCIQVVFILAGDANFLEADITTEEVDAAVYFRKAFGHDQRFMEAHSLTSLAHRLCTYSSHGEIYRLETAALQMNLLEDIESYLKDDGTQFEHWFNGRVVCVISLAAWFASVAKELSMSLDFLFAILRFPRDHSTKFKLCEGGLTFSHIGWCRLSWALVFTAVRIIIAGNLLWIGCKWLSGTMAVRDLLLNAVALDFIMNLDENLFDAFAPLDAKQLPEMFLPMSIGKPLRIRGVEWRSIFFFVCGAGVVLGFNFAYVNRMMDDMRGVTHALCDPPLDFTWGSDVFHLVQLSGTPKADTYGKLYASAVQEVLDTKSDKFTDISFPLVYSHNPNHWLMSVSDAMNVPDKRLIDLYNPGCIDLLDTSNANLSTQVAILLGSSTCTSIKRNTAFCTDFASKNGNLMRTMCPITCGCDNAFSDLAANSNRYGCPSSCAATQAYQDSRLAASCKNTDFNTLNTSIYWPKMVQFMNRFDAELSSLLEVHGCNISQDPEFFRDRELAKRVEDVIPQLCSGTHPSGMRAIALMCPDVCKCDDYSSHTCAQGPTSPWCGCLHDFKKLEIGASSLAISRWCARTYCPLQIWNREAAEELTRAELRIGKEYSGYLRPCNITHTCAVDTAATCKKEVAVCSSLTEGNISTYPCTCGTSSRSKVLCNSSMGLLNGKETGQLCNASNDWDGVCKYRDCTSVDGSKFSTFYPCKCGKRECFAEQKCTINGNHGVCEATCAASWFECDPGYVMMEDASHISNPTNSKCCEATCEAYTCKSTGWVQKHGVNAMLQPNETKCCEATCGVYTCKSIGWVKKHGVNATIQPNETICCEATCAAYTCKSIGWVKKHGGSAMLQPNETLCCEPTCAAYTCNATGWVKKYGVNDTLQPNTAVCCEATCKAYVCEAFGWVPRHSASAMLKPTETTCCEATCVTWWSKCDPGYMIMDNASSMTNPTKSTCCVPIPEPSLAWVKGNTGANQCPTGSDIITSQDDCELATRAFDGHRFDSAENASAYPKGCYVWSEYVYFNKNDVGAGQEDTTPVCKKPGRWTLIREHAYCSSDTRKNLAREGTSVKSCQAMALADQDCTNQMYGNGQACRCVRVGKECDFKHSSVGNNVYELQAT